MRYSIIVVVLIGFFLRIVALADYPAGFSADEVGQGYTAYSILNTGADEWGEPFPVAPRSYGDYRAPLYTYLTIPSITAFGLNEFAVRLPNAILGTLAIAVLYFLCKELFRDKKIGIFASFLLAVSPWHIALSRGAFEPNLPTLIIPLGILVFLKARANKNYMYAAALCFGLGLFSYYSFRVLFPAIAVILFILRKPAIAKHKTAFMMLLLFVLMAVYTMFTGASTRLIDVSIVGESSWQALSDDRYEAVLMGLPDTIARIFNNKLTYVVTKFSKNYLSYFSPQFLFTEGAGEATYGLVPGSGLLYPLELLFITVGLIYIIINKLYKDVSFKLILAMLVIAPVPAALATGPGMAANRAAVMLPWLTIISAIGIYAISKRLSNKYVPVLLVGYFLVSLVIFLEGYFFHAPRDNARSMGYGWREAAEYLRSGEPFFERIIISKGFSEPQMFVAFYLQINPTVVQRSSVDWLRYEGEGLKFVDQLGIYSLGKFVFKGIDTHELRSGSTLVMGRPEEFGETTPDHVVYYPDGEPAIYFVSSEETYAKNK